MSNSSCSANLAGTSKTVFIIMNIISGCASSIGNGVVILVICWSKLRCCKSNIFLLSLTLGDFFVGFLMNPLYITIVVQDVWMENSPLMAVENYLWIQSLTVTTFSLCFISIERYIAISRPFTYGKILTKTRCCLAIGFLWSFSLVAGIASFIVEENSLVTLWAACLSVVVFLPLGTMAYFYFKIFQEVSRHKRRMKKDSLETMCARQKNQKAVVTIGIIVGLFIICFAPSLVFSFLTMAQSDKCREMRLYRKWIWAILVNFSGSAINPWIYALRTNDFQRAFARLFGFQRELFTFNDLKWKVNLKFQHGEYFVNIKKSHIN
ncbi:probable G-protein coupled receptor No9 [Exaiptasia diaphana]|uniref:G-protein coupled receptors family 1 profile domain-containing protein n=1 Tax=Exaiptasia diaphana TaxID=2652724 RepID=A0A913X8Y1_EXADI|nr:probable G-protein coupled receptor No9 [Exaiptasia diaphana]